VVRAKKERTTRGGAGAFLLEGKRKRDGLEGKGEEGFTLRGRRGKVKMLPRPGRGRGRIRGQGSRSCLSLGKGEGRKAENRGGNGKRKDGRERGIRGRLQYMNGD